VAYSVMVWLVDPGEQAHQREALRRTHHWALPGPRCRIRR
jgi:hypothetical protein